MLHGDGDGIISSNSTAVIFSALSSPFGLDSSSLMIIMDMRYCLKVLTMDRNVSYD